MVLDVNECLETPSVCGPNSVCNNTIGDYNCTCWSGYKVTDPSLKSSANNTCTGKANLYISAHRKTHFSAWVSFFFSLYPFSDINECVEITNVCGSNSKCTNYNGSYNCSCLSGYQVTKANQSISVDNQCTGKWKHEFFRCLSLWIFLDHCFQYNIVELMVLDVNEWFYWKKRSGKILKDRHLKHVWFNLPVHWLLRLMDWFALVTWYPLRQEQL